MFNLNEEFSSDGWSAKKGSERIQINNILTAVSVGVLALLNGSDKAIPMLVNVALGSSIPVLICSSLAYSKICYRDQIEYKAWNTLGWWTHTLGYYGIIGALSILIFSTSEPLPAFALLGTSISLVIIYSIVDVTSAKVIEGNEESVARRRFRVKEKLAKGFVILILHVMPVVAFYLTPTPDDPKPRSSAHNDSGTQDSSPTPSVYTFDGKDSIIYTDSIH